MNYFTPTNLPCQLLNTDIVSNPRGFFTNNLTYTFKLIFKEYFSVSQNYKKVYISHEEIARRVGCHRTTVTKAVAYFEKMGIMATIYRHMNTSEYSMNEFFFTPTTRKNLSLVFNFFVPLALSVLVPKPVTTQLNINVDLESHSSSRNRERINYARDVRASGEQHGYLIFDVIEAKKESSEQFSSRRDVLEASARLMKLREKFPITSHGLIKLSIFPDTAIDHAESMLSAVYRAGEPYSYFLKLCKNYCEQNGIAIEWGSYYRLKVALGISNDEPTLDSDLLDGMRDKYKSEPTKKTYNKQNQQRERQRPEPHVETEGEAERRIFFEKFDTPFKYAQELERALHESVVGDPSISRILYYPPRWNSLSSEDRQLIISQTHTRDCLCGDLRKRQFLF